MPSLPDVLKRLLKDRREALVQLNSPGWKPSETHKKLNATLKEEASDSRIRDTAKANNENLIAALECIASSISLEACAIRLTYLQRRGLALLGVLIYQVLNKNAHDGQRTSLDSETEIDLQETYEYLLSLKALWKRTN